MDFDGVTNLVSQNSLYYRAIPARQGHDSPRGLYDSLCTLHVAYSSVLPATQIFLISDSAQRATLDIDGWLTLT